MISYTHVHTRKHLHTIFIIIIIVHTHPPTHITSTSVQCIGSGSTTPPPHMPPSICCKHRCNTSNNNNIKCMYYSSIICTYDVLQYWYNMYVCYNYTTVLLHTVVCMCKLCMYVCCMYQYVSQPDRQRSQHNTKSSIYLYNVRQMDTSYSTTTVVPVVVIK